MEARQTCFNPIFRFVIEQKLCQIYLNSWFTVHLCSAKNSFSGNREGRMLTAAWSCGEFDAASEQEKLREDKLITHES